MVILKLLLGVNILNFAHSYKIIHFEDENRLLEAYSPERMICTSESYNKTCCEQGQFQCLRGQCVPYDRVCNAHINGQTIYREDGSKNLKAENFSRLDMCIDCSEGSDEMGCADASCATRTDKCHQNCIDIPNNKSKCSCYKGYTLKSIENMEKCVDIDECSLSLHLCTHDCINLNGTYACSCRGNFKQNDKHCSAPTSDVLIFFNSDKYLFTYNLSNHSLNKYWITTPSAIDYNPINNYLYWADKNKIIFDNRLNKSINDFTINTMQWKEPVTDSLSLDWITDNIYWITKDVLRKHKIMVSKLNGFNIRTVLVQKDDEKLKVIQMTNLQLDPEKGVMYWITNYEKFGEISKASMNGDKQDLVHRFYLHFPVALTLDHVNNRKLYWLDRISNSIYSTYTDGTGITFVSSVEGGRTPKKIDVFENYLYWITERTNEVVRLDKFGRGKVEGLVVGLTGSRALKVYHKDKIEIKIDKNNSFCSQCDYLCLNAEDKFECACPDGSIHLFTGNSSKCVGVTNYYSKKTTTSCDCQRLDCQQSWNDCCDVCENTLADLPLSIATGDKQSDKKVMSTNVILISIMIIAGVITTILCIFSFLKPRNYSRHVN